MHLSYKDDIMAKGNSKTENEAKSTRRLQPYPIAIALSFIFLALYMVCVALHYILPESAWQMYRFWEMTLIGFTWLTSMSLLFGMLEIIIGSYYIAYTLIPLFNYFDKKYNTNIGGNTMRPLRFKPMFFAVTSFAVLTYVLCFIFDLIFPRESMTEIWTILLPGFTGLNWASFFIGLLGVIGYSVYILAVFVLIYNIFRVEKMPEMK